MAIPYRGKTSDSTYFVTASTFGKKALFQTERTARLLLDVLSHYRAQQKFFLHEFVLMPDHFHLLITPGEGMTLERAMQLIKGGFSHRARKELGMSSEVWQTSFFDRRLRDAAEYAKFRDYIHQNPVARHLCARAEDYPYGSATTGIPLDPVPQRLKPLARPAEMQG